MSRAFIESKISLPGEMVLSSGLKIRKIEALYSIYRSEKPSNKYMLILPAFSGGPVLKDWIPGILNPILTGEYNLVSVAVLGSIHGTTFECDEVNPFISIEDNTDFTVKVLNRIGIDRVSKIFGCSFGGMLALSVFSRHASLSDDFFIGAASELPSIVKCQNQLQIDMIDNMEDKKQALKYCRYLFRLMCSGIGGVENLANRKKDQFDSASEYFRLDSVNYSQYFSPMAYKTLLLAMNRFKFALPETSISGKRVTIVDIEGDSFTHINEVDELRKKLARISKINKDRPGNGIELLNKSFSTDYGHEGWLTDYRSFEPFIRDFLNEH